MKPSHIWGEGPWKPHTHVEEGLRHTYSNLGGRRLRLSLKHQERVGFDTQTHIWGLGGFFNPTHEKWTSSPHSYIWGESTAPPHTTREREPRHPTHLERGGFDTSHTSREKPSIFHTHLRRELQLSHTYLGRRSCAFPANTWGLQHIFRKRDFRHPTIWGDMPSTPLHITREKCLRYATYLQRGQL